MLTEIQRDFIGKALRTMQLIVAAMAAGVVMFSVLALGFLFAGGDDPSEPFISYVAAGAGVVAFAASFVVPGAIVRKARQSLAEGDVPQFAAQVRIPPEVGVAGLLAMIFQTRLIVAVALLEGAAFFNLIAVMTEEHYLGLVTAGVLLVIIVGKFPTRGRLETWVSHELENVEQMRM